MPMSAWLNAKGPWLERMLTTNEETVTRVVDMERWPDEKTPLCLAHGYDVRWTEFEGHDIDETDPASLGAMLGHLRKVYNDPQVWIQPHRDGFAVLARIDGGEGFDGVGMGPTEAKALADAYQAKP